MQVIVRGKPITLTDETIQKTRLWYIYSQRLCIQDAETGIVTVRDIDSYIADCIQAIADIERGGWDNSWSFAQRALEIQTGECVPFMEKGQ